MASAPRKKRKNKHKEFLDANRHRYEEILAAQGGGCALCDRPPSPRRRLDLDHDHKRFVLRGLLCHKCNRALPDWVTPEWLERAIPYIQGEV